MQQQEEAKSKALEMALRNLRVELEIYLFGIDGQQGALKRIEAEENTISNHEATTNFIWNLLMEISQKVKTIL